MKVNYTGGLESQGLSFWQSILLANKTFSLGSGSHARLGYRRGPSISELILREPCLAPEVGDPRSHGEANPHPPADQRISETDPGFPEPR